MFSKTITYLGNWPYFCSFHLSKILPLRKLKLTIAQNSRNIIFHSTHDKNCLNSKVVNKSGTEFCPLCFKHRNSLILLLILFLFVPNFAESLWESHLILLEENFMHGTANEKLKKRGFLEQRIDKSRSATLMRLHGHR